MGCASSSPQVVAPRPVAHSIVPCQEVVSSPKDKLASDTSDVDSTCCSTSSLCSQFSEPTSSHPALVQTVDEDDVADFFDEQMLDKDNYKCVDSHKESPTWADVSHGVYLSIEMAGVHRSLGRETCCVRSLDMDCWTEDQLRTMKVGGNKRLMEVMRQQGVPDEMPVRQRYATVAAAWYRQVLRAEVRGESPPPPPSYGTGSLPTAAVHVDDGVASRSQKLLSNAF